MQRNEAGGASRCVPVVGYVGGRAGDSFCVGARIEDRDTDVRPPWVPEVANVAWLGFVKLEDTVIVGSRRLRGRRRPRSRLERCWLDVLTR
jgi:hypothetical protein